MSLPMMLQGVVVDTEIPMDQPVAGGDDEPPGYLRIGLANVIGDMHGRFADQFQIAHSGVVVQSTSDKTVLTQALRCRQ